MSRMEGIWALNTRKGTKVQNADIGDLPGGVATPISERQANIAKHLHDVVVFHTVITPEKERVEEPKKQRIITED